MKTKNQKWVYIGIAVVAILGLAFWYFTKKDEESTGEIKGAQAPSAPTKPEPGEANAISDLLPDCQKKFESWKRWMKSAKPDWYKDISEKAKKSSTPIDKALANTWLWMYNEARGDCWK